jgi:hypothetical protein
MNSANDALGPPFGELPDELILLVLSHLEVQRGFILDPALEAERQADNARTVGALHSLTLTCRRLAGIATPYLYTNFIQTIRHLGATACLLRTLADNPGLARYIKYVEDLTIDPHKSMGNRLHSQMNMEKLRNLVDPVECADSDVTLQFSFQNFFPWDDPQLASWEQPGSIWRQLDTARDRFPHVSAMVMLLLLADNISEFASHHSTPLTTALTFRSFSSGGLQKVWFKGNFWSPYNMSLATVSTSSQTNSLQRFLRPRFAASKVSPDDDIDLMELSFDIFDIDMRELCEKVASCRSLTAFSWRWVSALPDFKNLPPELSIDLPLLGQALQKFATTLESLRIDTQECVWPTSLNMDVSAMGSLRNFTSLIHLEVSALVLWGDYDAGDYNDPPLSTLLPESLETLDLKVEWDDQIEEVLYALLPECSRLLPNLRRFECTWRPAPRHVAEYLVDSYRDVGVELVLDVGDIRGFGVTEH